MGTAKAKVSQAEANLAAAEQQLRDPCVLAPFDGTVLKILKHPGEGVRRIELEPVVLFGDLSRLRVRAEVDERFVSNLRVGLSAEVYGRNLISNSNRPLHQTRGLLEHQRSRKKGVKNL